ncbi:hypothetical protein ACFL35_19825, partial [Candidatus Riflebacteria bacterium]
ESFQWIKENGYSVRAHTMDLRPRPEYDYVLCIHILDSLTDMEERKGTLQRAYSFLKPEGKIYILTELRGKDFINTYRSKGWVEYQGGFRCRKSPDKYRFPFHQKELFAILKRSGLTPVNPGFSINLCHAFAEKKLFKIGDTSQVSENWSARAFKNAGSQAKKKKTIPLPYKHRDIKGYVRPENPIKFIQELEVMERVLERVQKERVIGLDVETTIYEKPRKLCTVQIATRSENFIFDALVPGIVPGLAKILQGSKIIKVIHNAVFEKSVLKERGIEILNIFDTLTVSRKLRGSSSSGGHGLARVCERELGLFLDKNPQKSDWTRRPLSFKQLRYAALDAEILLKLFEIFSPPAGK